MTDPIEEYFLGSSVAAWHRSNKFFAELLGMELPEPEIQAPRFQRLNCPNCRFLGGTHHDGQEYDLYFCTEWKSVVFTSAKTRCDGNHYLDEPGYRQVALTCLVKAIEKGFLFKKHVLTGCRMARVGDYLGDNDG